MTSETGQTPLRPASELRRQAQAGFTLFELILALSLVVLLGVMVVLSLPSLDQRVKFEEAVRQLEAVLRLGRAESASTGKRLRLEFAAEGSFKVTWEPQPLTEPGVFQDYTVPTWARELLVVRSCRLTSPSLQTPQESMVPTADGAVLSPIIFYPDGSCDSAVIQAGGKQPDEIRTAVIEMDGINGIITTRLLLPSELEEYLKSNAQP